jgi:hypothetical protein
MIITYKNLELFAWDNVKYCYKDILNKNIGFKLEIGQRFQRVGYDGTNKEIYFDVTLKDFNSNGMYIERYREKEVVEFVPWQKIFKNWKGEKELLNLVIEPIDKLFTYVDVTKQHDNNKIYDNYSGDPCYSRFHKNINYFCKLGQIEMEE